LIVAAILVGVAGGILTVGVEDVNEGVLILKHCAILLLILVDAIVVLWPWRRLLTMDSDTPDRRKTLRLLKWACWVQAAVGVVVLAVVGQLMV
jgi:predicted anti-sigma-YlaC factor YlaD